MVVDDNGPSGPEAAPADGGDKPSDGQPSGGQPTGDKPAGGQPTGDKPTGDEPAGADTGSSKLREALGEGQRRGRRPRDAGQPDGLFAAEVRDEDLGKVYVEPDDDYERALRALAGHRVVVLQGRPGSGRHAMARHLLLHGLPRHDLEVARIHELGSNTELGRLQLGDKGIGYVLERCPPEQASRLRADELRADEAALEDRKCFLIVTVDDGVTVLEGEDSQQLVPCTRVPDLILVLERHLELHLRDQNGLREEDRRWLRGDTIRAYLTRHGELRQAVRLARELARPLSAPPTPDRYQQLDGLLEAEPPEQRARRRLERSPDVEHWAQVIALAVYEGGQSHVVADAAGLLAKRLAPADLRSETAWRPGPTRAGWIEPAPADQSSGDGAAHLLRRMALGVPDDALAWRPGPARSDWLEQAGGEPFDALEHAILFNRSPTRRVRFKDPALRAAVLDLVWNEFDELRGPVRDWLDELGGDHDPEVREQTAIAVAYLASHGLGYVLELIIVPWIRRGPWTRAVAALALGILGRDDRRFTGSVLAQLSQWARWGDEDERETVAMAYGFALGPARPAIALRELRALALRGGAQLPVAEALCELVRRWRHREVLEALCEWTERPERATWSPAEQRLLRTGLAGFLLATRVFDETGLWPVLLRLAAEDPKLREQIVVLWRRALADDVRGEVAGDKLCAWAREADVQASAGGGFQPDLVEALHGLVAGIAAGGSAHGGRVRQALTRCANAYDDPSPVARQLVEVLV
jgi:hypothetical protein